MFSKSKTARRYVAAPMLLLAAALVLAFLQGGSGAETGPPKEWLTKLVEAKTAAARDKKPIFAMISSNDCPPCEIMKRDVLPKQPVVEALSKYVRVYINADNDQNDAMALKVEAFPTFVVFNAQGEEQGRFMGLRETPAAFLDELSSIEKVADALADINSHIAKTPRDAALWKLKGDLLTNAGRQEEGMAAYQKANTLDPQNKTGVKEELEFFDMLKKIDGGMERKDAVAALAAFAEKHPDATRVEDSLYLRAYLTALQSDWPAAKALVAQYKAKFPKGRMAARADRLDKAIDDEAKKAQAAKATPTPATP